MPNGFTGVILRVDLSTGEIKRQEMPEDFYRTYMGGGALGAYFLLTETVPGLDPLDPANILTIAPSITTGAAISGVSRCSAVSLSPLTGAVGEGQAGGKTGPLIKRAGYDAIVVTGRADRLSYLVVEPDKVTITDAQHLAERPVSEVCTLLEQKHTEKGWSLSILQCGPAGERQVRFACLLSDRNDAVGRTGMGAVMGSKNLRAIVVRARNTDKVAFADPEGLKRLASLGVERLKTAEFPTTLKAHGTPGIVGFQSGCGNMASYNYRTGFHPEHMKLAGDTYDETLGAGFTTCYGCAIGCRKKMKADAPYPVSDALGGPEFETLSTLGTNLDIVEITAVARANELCNEYGMDTITMGALAAYVFESMEQGCLTPSQMEGKTLRFGQPEDLFWLIERVGRREGPGAVLAEGFQAAIAHFGPETAPFAIHCKGQGLPAHMAQFKPTQALMYAAVPIGGDHMSCEHDWLAVGGELLKSLGVIGQPTRASMDLPKVRMTAYSQHLYSLLDTLTLCMFCWGPGNLFTYHELVELVRNATGWDCTFWELLKAGERKTTMMRQINARRGFTAQDDILPERLYEPIPDGPSKGLSVDRVVFPKMLRDYYAVMGWDTRSGNPTPGKLMELGLEWALETA
ncbi:MAG: putative oxidoreductase YdhV [Candidatus Hydrogenedentes bacterium ADurb.Bin179]|nr:MAG: putative oxidoreductase YdhV [Candidatus Hydrogenedentes bacterium ADurb.Bin179]